jgi:hypothetical protein
MGIAPMMLQILPDGTIGASRTQARAEPRLQWLDVVLSANSDER